MAGKTFVGTGFTKPGIDIFELKAMFKLSYHKKYTNLISEVIRAATSSAGTDHDSLIRVIVRRAEIDLLEVREAYLEM
ncbi:hypothetical protein L1887_13658 [Cichorium endivia]|nr:hypothetical protein L1887_13658 [Cichorium endivia]